MMRKQERWSTSLRHFIWKKPNAQIEQIDSKFEPKNPSQVCPGIWTHFALIECRCSTTWATSCSYNSCKNQSGQVSQLKYFVFKSENKCEWIESIYNSDCKGL